MVAAVAWAAWAIWICDAAIQPRGPASSQSSLLNFHLRPQWLAEELLGRTLIPLRLHWHVEPFAVRQSNTSIL